MPTRPEYKLYKSIVCHTRSYNWRHFYIRATAIRGNNNQLIIKEKPPPPRLSSCSSICPTTGSQQSILIRHVRHKGHWSWKHSTDQTFHRQQQQQRRRRRRSISSNEEANPSCAFFFFNTQLCVCVCEREDNKVNEGEGIYEHTTYSFDWIKCGIGQKKEEGTLFENPFIVLASILSVLRGERTHRSGN